MPAKRTIAGSLKPRRSSSTTAVHPAKPVEPTLSPAQKRARTIAAKKLAAASQADSDSDGDANELSVRTTRSIGTPSKRRSPCVSSPRPKTSSPLKRSSTTMLSDSDAESNVPHLPTPRKTPSRIAITPTKATPTAPRLSRSASSTPTRFSPRNRGLPPNLLEIKNAPASLRNRLVGFHMEDEGYGKSLVQEDDEEDEEDDQESEKEEEVREARRKAKGKGRVVNGEEEQEDDLAIEMQVDQPSSDFGDDPFTSSTTSTALSRGSYTLPAPPPVLFARPSSSPTYASSHLHIHLTRQLSILSGANLPESPLAPDATSPRFSKDKGVMGYPFLEGGYEEWERPLRGCLNEVVTRGMGNAVVMLGPRGVGKTMLVDRTLRILSYIHGDAHDFITVKLSGLVHTTDRLALRSIAMQLRQQGFSSAGASDEDCDEGDYSSNSATMTTLLRLLEPSSTTNTSAPSTSSASASLAKPIIIIVDEFDLFALHPRQSFLYCLLDIVQGNRRRGGVGVVGVSARVDCLSLLEKRVRSRCQSHVLQMMLPSTFTAFVETGKRLMRADQRAWKLVKGEEAGEWAAKWNDEVERFWKQKKVGEYMDRLWKAHGNVPTELRSTLSHFFYRLDFAMRTGEETDASHVPKLSLDLLKPQEAADERDPVLKHLSMLELTVLVACKHLSASTLDRQAGFNLEMAYDQYLQHVRRSSTTGFGLKSYGREAFCGAFDSLRTAELLLPLSSSATFAISSPAYLAPSRAHPFKLYRLVPWVKDVDREVDARGGECPLALRRWCKNWLD
ncbi:hypothetical protein JCM21900_004525 [Sporobolomyces salmonicolor]